MRNRMMRVLMALALFSWFPGSVGACMTGAFQPWHVALPNSFGVSIVVPTIFVGEEDSIAVYHLETDKRERDGTRSSPNSFIAAVAYSIEHLHVIPETRNFGFWSGIETAAKLLSGCNIVQRVLPGRPHALLWGISGTYALEPILGDDDPWLATVLHYFNTRGDLLTHSAEKLLQQELLSVDFSGCKVQVSETPREALDNCIRVTLEKYGDASVIHGIFELRSGSMYAGVNVTDYTLVPQDIVTALGESFRPQDPISLLDLLQLDP